MMTEETTTEQLAEIDRDMAEIERQVAELVEEAQRADYPPPEPATTTEQLAEIEGQPQPVQVREGRWRTRGGHYVCVEPMSGDDFASIAYGYTWRGCNTPELQWNDNGLCEIDSGEQGPMDLVEYLGPIESDKTQELPEYTPPDGWRVVQIGEQLLPGDVWVNHDGTEQRSNILQWDASAVSGGRCIRRIKPEAQPESQPQPEAEPVQVREGRWRTRGGDIKNIRPCEPLKGAYYVWPWTDGFMTFQDNGRHQGSKESPNDLIEYLGPIEPEPQQVNDWPSVRDLRHELKTVQTQLGESRQRVKQLEELVGSLRTINRGCENAVREAGNMNTALRNQLAAVKAELASVAADRQQLRVELDAAQQVPADSPELRQLRADLEQATLGRDTYRDGYNRVLSDLETARETAKAEAVEAIAEWLEPIRLVDSAYLANATMQHLPQIMRHLTGLDSHAID